MFKEHFCSEFRSIVVNKSFDTIFIKQKTFVESRRVTYIMNAVSIFLDPDGVIFDFWVDETTWEEVYWEDAWSDLWAV